MHWMMQLIQRVLWWALENLIVYIGCKRRGETGFQLQREQKVWSIRVQVKEFECEKQQGYKAGAYWTSLYDSTKIFEKCTMFRERLGAWWRNTTVILKRVGDL